MTEDLFRKYDVPAPRYTSYPTVPYWEKTPTWDEWQTSVRESLSAATASWSLYLHIPFCETLCTFCGCNTTITKNHTREVPYVGRLLKEKDFYFEHLPILADRTLSQLHLGGGTPTFLDEEALRTLMTGIFRNVRRDSNFEGSIEIDPRRTRPSQLAVLKEFGFSRVSLGVQDFDVEVQRLIHRRQTLAQTKDILLASREMGYESANFDLIYGLPKQTIESMRATILLTIELRPERIALYSFAKVPWIKPAQRLFKDEDLPEGAAKRELYEFARELLLGAGYVEIGMDHFALPHDAMARSLANGTLHRNFMGYTEKQTDLLLGLGVSAISESKTCFVQNEKVLPKYEELIDEGRWAVFRGHVLSRRDRFLREKILNLMTRGQVSISDLGDDFRERVVEFEKDHLISTDKTELRVSDLGRPFLRNICLAFDERFLKNKPDAPLFSQSL